MKILIFLLVSFLSLESISAQTTTFSFPKSTIPTPPKVCDYRHDAVFALSNETDVVVSNSKFAAEFYAFAKNIKPTAFVSPYDAETTGLLDMSETGKIDLSMYLYTDRWLNPITGVNEIIPDYYASAWTSAGVAAFGTTLGASKATRYPNHGQELFDLTSGALGYNITAGTPGTNRGKELLGVINASKDFIRKNTGREASSFSYRNGQNGSAKMLLPYFLAGRNSFYSTTGDSRTTYGISKDNAASLGLPSLVTDRIDRINQASSVRWWDAWHPTGTEAAATAYVQGEIAKCITNKGWFNNFMHWHDAYNAGDVDAIKRLMDVMNTAIGSTFCWRAGYREVMEYLFYREMVTAVSAYEDGNNVQIAVLKQDPYAALTSNGIKQKLPLETINTPISIWVNLSGTVLDGKDIQSDVGGIRKVSANIFVVDIPFGNDVEGVSSCNLSETSSPAYQNHTVPTYSQSVSGGVLTITSNIATKAVLFQRSTGGAESTVKVAKRDNDLSTSHSFTLSAGNDYNVGLISEMGQSVLGTTESY